MLFDDIAVLARDADPIQLAEILEVLAPRRESRGSARTAFRRRVGPVGSKR